MVTAVIGFALLFAINLAFNNLHIKNHDMTKIAIQPSIGLVTTVEFCSHALIEGIAIGVSFQLQFGLGVFVAVAVVSHDFCDGVSTLALMLNSGNSMKSSISMLIIDAIAPVFGAITTLFFAVQSYILVYALLFLLGSFLYIGGGMLLPDAYRMNRSIVTVSLFLTSFLLIILLIKIVGF